ncbi:exopolysaccharide biosynthesis protein [Tabrizicola sp.]|uniref:exopolysaccharide biosynthesis protein n=1 Tax=Tabrizicola sp. TaxID=2005166 RepID=UPI003D27F648
MQHDTERLSQILPRLAEGDQPRLTVAELIERMQDRAHAALLVLFALPNTLPAIPGTSALTGIPLVYLSLQLTLGQKPWLPAFIAKRSFPRESLASVLDQAKPWLLRSEGLLHPRLGQLTGPRAEKLVGILMLFMACMVVLPIPFGNMLPSLAIIFFALGLLEEDGLWVIAGAVMVVVNIVVFATLLWGLFKAAVFVFLGAFGFAP